MLNKRIITLSISSVLICNIVAPSIVSAKTIKLDELEISVPNNLPSFNESISKKYESALNSLKEEGYDGNISTNDTLSNTTIDKNINLFSEKFPNYTNSLNTEVVEEKMEEMKNAFNEVYQDSITEELPSKEATLIWDKEEVLNSALKPQGYDEALKKTTAKLEGGVSEEFKNNIEGKIDSIFSYLNIHQNDKPTQPDTPIAGTPETPDLLLADKPDPIPVPDLKVPELKKPTVETPSLPIIALPTLPSGGFPSGSPNTSIVPETVPETVPSTVPSTVPNTVPSTSTSTNKKPSTSTQPSTSPSTNNSKVPTKTPSKTPVSSPSTVPQKDDETNKGNTGKSWKDSIVKGGLITAAGVVIYKGAKIAIGAITAGLPGALAGALT